MNFYDKVHELVRSLKETNEYKQYIELKNNLKEDQKSYDMLKDFKQKQSELQIKHFNGEKMSEEEKSSMENIYSVIIQNETIRKILENEMKINVMLADMQKIIGEGFKEIIEF